MRSPVVKLIAKCQHLFNLFSAEAAEPLCSDSYSPPTKTALFFPPAESVGLTFSEKVKEEGQRFLLYWAQGILNDAVWEFQAFPTDHFHRAGEKSPQRPYSLFNICVNYPICR